MSWPDEVSTSSGTTAGGTAFRRAQIFPGGSDDRSTVSAPVSLVDGSPAVLVVCAHGTGGSDGTMDFGSSIPVRDVLLDAGYVVAAANFHGNTWGNSVWQQDAANLHAWATSVWDITDVLYYGASQGGGAVLAAHLRKTLPDVRGVCVIAPALNFQWVNDLGGSGPAIRSAYGATTANFNEKIQGYGPLTGVAQDYANIGLLMYGSYEDTTTPKDQHADTFVSQGLSALSRETTVNTVTGAHLSVEHYHPAEIAAFYERCLEPLPPTQGGSPGKLGLSFNPFLRVPTGWVSAEPWAWDGYAWVRLQGNHYIASEA